MLLENLKHDLNEAILQFHAKEQTLTPEGNQHVLELHLRIDAATFTSQLRASVMQYLAKVPHRFFYFFPFVNDLRKRVEGVFALPQYDNNALTLADSMIWQETTKTSLDKIAVLEKQIKAQTFPELETLKRQVNRQQQTINGLNLEVSTLRSSIRTLQDDYNTALDSIEQLQSEKQQLATQNQNLMNRNLSLEQRNRALEAELESYRNGNSRRLSAQL